jgi:hypothetical protein
MWQYYDSYSKASSSMDDLIPRYPASALLPGSTGVNLDNSALSPLDAGQYVPSYPGGSNSYDLPSQPELTQGVKYPSYHNVHKHGKYGIPQTGLESEVAGGGGMSNGNGRDLNINVNRRTHLSSSKQDDARRESSNNLWANFYSPGVPQSAKYPEEVVANEPYAKNRFRFMSPSNDADLNDKVNSEDGDQGGEPYPPQHPQARWKREATAPRNKQKGLKDHLMNDPAIKRLMKRHIGPHDADGIQRLISTGAVIFFTIQELFIY